MIYYLFLAIIDIGMYINENWKELTFVTAASAIGVILGKRIGTRIAINYAMKMLGISQETEMEQQHKWLMGLEEARGNQWIAPISRPYRVNIRQILFKRSLLSRMMKSIARFIKLRMILRRKNMLLALRNPWSKKLFAFIVLVMLNGLNDTLQLHLSPQTINNITTLGTTYIVSQAGVDALKPVILLILSKFSVKTAVSASSNVTLSGGTYAKPPIDTSADK